MEFRELRGNSRPRIWLAPDGIVAVQDRDSRIVVHLSGGAEISIDVSYDDFMEEFEPDKLRGDNNLWLNPLAGMWSGEEQADNERGRSATMTVVDELPGVDIAAGMAGVEVEVVDDNPPPLAPEPTDGDTEADDNVRAAAERVLGDEEVRE